MRCVLLFFPVGSPVPLFCLAVPYFSVTGLTLWPVRRWASTRGSKNRPGRPPWTEGPTELSRIEAFQLATLALRTHPGLCVLGFSKDWICSSASREAPPAPPLGLGNAVGAWIELDSGL